MVSTVPLYHLYGDPPNDEAFDFIHVERIASRSSVNDWQIRPHRHRNLFQILLIERGGGTMMLETKELQFSAPSAILVPAVVTHAFQFKPNITNGWVVTFTDDVVATLTNGARAAPSRLIAFTEHPIVPISEEAECGRLSNLCAELLEEYSLAREGYQLMMRGLLAQTAVGIVRLATSLARTGSVTLHPADATVAKFRAFVDEYFHTERTLGFYAEKLCMTSDRLNDHVRRATGVTAGRVIRQRLITEAKRRLVFSGVPVSRIAADLGFADASHFTRFFRKYTSKAPHAFRDEVATNRELLKIE
jgi:AraC family transcriptional regulator, transcriptional activator of pobA